MNLDQLRSRRAEILTLAEQHGAHNVRVFGSVVRGESGSESDIDLLIDMDEQRSLLDLVALWQDLQDMLGRRVDVVTERSLHWYIRDRVLREARPL
ncbi:nucleotidyltransferase family protein [Candidatus Chloroploca sp. M-50]|uniref:Nucleotidyltransferase family protein n=1 Tax=Candidatus Chloroploca mongolica TaxID=2528176 RepID=A0ABS4D9V8_9CHLR|nr:nucleotidyltransferase family protein [Candidatus Chloroploca mongolica]MBP1466234.1 nucleotidyltransferase family protein [Candidatus Chloroploca mongolica]